jgi:hypothetical protein
MTVGEQGVTTQDIATLLPRCVHHGRTIVLYRRSIELIALAMLLATIGTAQAFDESKYPDWKGQWRRFEPGPPRYDPSKPVGRGQQAPLTEEYKAVHAASVADQGAGGQGNDPTYSCVPPGMPRIMSVYDPMEIVITPATTHILIQHVHDSRRVFTDGRLPSTSAGFAATRSANGSIRRGRPLRRARNRDPPFEGPPRYVRPACLCTTTIKHHQERLYSDRSEPNHYNEITTIDNALAALDGDQEISSRH